MTAKYTKCGYCTVQQIKDEAAEDAMIVTVRARGKGVDIFKHPADVTLEADAHVSNHTQLHYWQAWFSAKSTKCTC